jgi:Tol biopolymer transport system component
MQLWRMRPDGGAPEQLTNDAYNNWFPHISPDGKWIVFLSFMQDVKPDDLSVLQACVPAADAASGGKPQCWLTCMAGRVPSIRLLVTG